MKLKFFALFLLVYVFALPVSAFAAVQAGYDPETGQIILPSEAGLDYNYVYQLQPSQSLQSLTEDSTPQMTPEQYQQYQDSLAEARDERARIQLWEKMDN